MGVKPTDCGMLAHNVTTYAVTNITLSGIEQMFLIFLGSDLSLLYRCCHFSLWASDENLRIQILSQYTTVRNSRCLPGNLTGVCVS